METTISEIQEMPETLQITSESLNVPTIVCIISCVVAFFVMIVSRSAFEKVTGYIWVISTFTAIAGVVVAIIAMLFFHVPFAKIAPAGNIVLLVLLPFLSINIIYYLGGSILYERQKQDKYNLWIPGSLCRSIVVATVILGIIFLIVVFLVGLIAKVFFKVDAEQVNSACKVRYLWIIAVNIVLLVICLIADAIRKMKYEIKFREMVKREEKAHIEFDTIIREAIDSNGLVDESQIKEYCKGKHITKYQDFLDFSFFIPDGLKYYISIGQIRKIETHAEKNKKVVLYQTTIPKKLSEVREEISLDDE